MKKVILYIHGKGGSHTKAEQYKEFCAGFDIIGIDYKDDFPWIVEDNIQAAYNKLRREYEEIYILANSIGVYFAMQTLQKYPIAKAFFISPVLDMEQLILDMMQWAQITERELHCQGEIPTDFGETLSWKYLKFVREHPIFWNIPTEILYAENDHLISRQTVDNFVAAHNAALTVMPQGEHWFHTDEQLAFLYDWLKKSI